MAKKLKLGASVLEIVDELVEEPMSAAFGGKGTLLTHVVKACEKLMDSEVEAVSPTKFSKILHAINRDGDFILYEAPDEEDEDEEDEEEPWDREELEEMSAGELREEAKAFKVRLTPKRGGKSGKIKKAAKVLLIDAIMEAQNKYFGIEEVDEDDEDDIELYTKAELREMSKAELVEIADEWELEVKKPTAKKLAKAILKFQEEELE